MATEDLLDASYDEVDTDSEITVTTDRVTWSGTDTHDNKGHWLVKDFGAAFFDGDFVHHFTVEHTAASASTHPQCWMMSNAVDGYGPLYDANATFLSCSFEGDFDLHIDDIDAGTEYRDWAASVSINTVYYIEIERDESVTTNGTFYLRLYSDANRETLIETLSLALTQSKTDYRYYFPFNSAGWDSTTHLTSGYVEDVNLDAGVVPTLDQAAWAFLVDDDVYADATRETEDTHITEAKEVIRGLGTLIQATDDPESKTFKQQFKLKIDDVSEWEDTA
jgi:hypothetical protein